MERTGALTVLIVGLADAQPFESKEVHCFVRKTSVVIGRTNRIYI